MRRAALATAVACLAFACSKKEDEPAGLDRQALMDPQSCAECHPNHFREWSSSMHAYAGDDPVFLALNARGQRETNGELGDFCVKCHAPMAVREGLTTDGLNLAELPDHMRGVTCYFCHSVDAVEGDHNNPLRLSDDLTMRGSYRDAVPNDAHASAYSALHDRGDLSSATMCGSCHDIVTPLGGHIERTFLEWQGTLFSKPELGEPQTCGNCHMRGRDDVAADYEGVFLRRVHDHSMPGVDIAVTPWPGRDEQRALVQKSLDTTVLAELCVYPEMGRVVVSLENVAAGHSFPSGSTPDRRAWVELIGYHEDEIVWEVGVLDEDDAVIEAARADERLWWFGDKLLDVDGNETHFFWEAADFDSNLLRGPVARSPLDPGWVDPHVVREFENVPFVDRVQMRVLIRPIGLEILRDLVASNDLDEAVIAQMPTFSLAASDIEWRVDSGRECSP